ncbi:MAG: AbrB/MazE/SpoVT family DNA-binding domain-containing protein [Deltaproteobacteria bacterium]|nr:AbrB/MazE/SpoVT family DNA-binding domain-containing protein [Deltaproteobacteria bacterium]
MKIAVSSKGQVTIPKPVRRRLGLVAGTQLRFRESGGRLIGEKLGADDPVSALLGAVKLRKTSDQMLALVRGEVQRR